MACHTVHYDTTVLLGRLVPFVSVSIVMLPGPRRSARDKAAREKAMKESEEGAARDSDAEDASEADSDVAQDQTRARAARTSNYLVSVLLERIPLSCAALSWSIVNVNRCETTSCASDDDE